MLTVVSSFLPLILSAKRYQDMPQDCDLVDEEDSPKETDASEEAQTRQFFARSWKFLVLHNLSLVQILLTSII